MKKILVAILLILPVFITGCFSLKKVSYTDVNTSDKKNVSENNLSDSGAKKNSNPEFKFVYGKTSYSEKNTEPVIKNKFKSIGEFDAYVQDIKKQSDEIMKIAESQSYTKAEMNKAVNKNNFLLDTVKRIDIPESIITTSQGKYYANRYAKVELESLLSLRSELLECFEEGKGKNSKVMDEKINSLKDGVIPIKEYAVKISRQNMMEEEGYVWNETSKKYILNK